MYSLMLFQHAILESVKKNQCQITQLYKHCDLNLPEGCRPNAHAYNCMNIVVLEQSPSGKCHPSVRALGSSFSCNLVKDVCFSIKQLLLCLPPQCTYLQSNFWIPVSSTAEIDLLYCHAV
ncbi:hypothetical protein EJB00_02540 [Wolbachia endosymbiont of Drosophila mauritiana]|nr:hypothetical protein EJA99_02545 [Wolbachia endosymbiont of Drosophila mauritiana]QCB64162.1 hypothetical protein EJB00_02540 [Wolbachia endosymbiont of Drosophila mauritiana]QWE33170.1 Uncharacterized protein WwMa_02420 [Wolbachia endosymbiont of Drosophila simulans]TGB06904.1 hypothetical protein E5C28_02615 [Wolbachia endosymbiont of Drosophila mauritiana]